jgi:hypothetical protein
VSTFLEIIEDTLAEVSSYVRNQEAITVITQTATDSETTLTVDDASSLSRGVVEIGDELIYIKSVNQTAGTVSVLPGGRGWRGTTASAHSVNTILRNNPTFPRDQVRRAINDTIRGIDLRALSSHEFEFDGTQYAYAMPTDFQDVTGVAWNAPDSTEVWPLIKRYRIDRNYRATGDTSTVRAAIVLMEYPMPGRNVRVQYAKYPTALSADTDDFYSTTGLPASAEDVIRFGAMWRLVSTIDPGKVVATTPSADLVDTPIGPGDSTSVARYLYQLFNVRLAEEKAKQQDNYLSIIQYAR